MLAIWSAHSLQQSQAAACGKGRAFLLHFRNEFASLKPLYTCKVTYKKEASGEGTIG